MTSGDTIAAAGARSSSNIPPSKPLVYCFIMANLSLAERTGRAELPPPPPGAVRCISFGHRGCISQQFVVRKVRNHHPSRSIVSLAASQCQRMAVAVWPRTHPFGTTFLLDLFLSRGWCTRHFDAEICLFLSFLTEHLRVFLATCGYSLPSLNPAVIPRVNVGARGTSGRQVRSPSLLCNRNGPRKSIMKR